MSEYKEFLEEKNKIDEYFEKGYKINNITENLSGMFIELSLEESKQESIQLHLLTAEGRKYISTKLMYSN